MQPQRALVGGSPQVGDLRAGPVGQADRLGCGGADHRHSPVDGRRLAGGQGIDLGLDVLVLDRHRKVNLQQAQGVPVAQFVLDGGCIADGLPGSKVSVGR